MAHNLFSSRFYSLRKPAWHGLGFVSIEESTAEQALQVVGSYQVDKVPLVAQMADGSTLVTDYSAIVRQPTADDPVQRVFGSPVHKGYELLTPDRAVSIFDRGCGNVGGSVATPVETLGILGKGEELFITSKIATFDVAENDPVESYLFFYSPMYSGKAAILGRTEIRITCQNTLRIALNNTIQRVSIPHDKSIETYLVKWLSETTEFHRDQQAIVEEAYRVLAKTPITDDQVFQVVNSVYEYPPTPEPSWVGRFNAKTTFDQYMEYYEQKVEAVDQIREAVVDLYQTSGTSIAQGTAWGAYNAFTEFETYSKTGSQVRSMVSQLVGDRSTTMSKAYSVITATLGIGGSLN